MSKRRRLTVGAAVMGLAGAIGVGAAPAAHAQSAGPQVSAAISTFASTAASTGASTEYAFISGTGFTPWGTVTIELIDTITGAVLETTTEQAMGSSLGGIISIVLPLPDTTTGSVTVEAIDGASGATSNQVAASPAHSLELL